MGKFKDLAIIEENKKQELFHEQALQLQREANALASRIAARKGSGLYRYRFAGPYAPAQCIDCVSEVRKQNPEMKPNDWLPAVWVGWQFDAACDSCDMVPNGGSKDRAQR
jgi:hypothetical protein